MSAPTVRVPVRIEFHLALNLDEPQARALHALTAYGADSFLRFFYTTLGKTCLEPHEAGLRSLFDALRVELSPGIQRVDDLRKLIEEGIREQAKARAAALAELERKVEKGNAR